MLDRSILQRLRRVISSANSFLFFNSKIPKTIGAKRCRGTSERKKEGIQVEQNIDSPPLLDTQGVFPPSIAPPGAVFTPLYVPEELAVTVADDAIFVHPCGLHTHADY